MTALNPTPGTVYSDIEDWVRRIIKFPSSESITSQTIGDYVNRFYTYDAPVRLQLFEMKRSYVFETETNIFMYQFPYRNYQMILQPIYCDGVQMALYQSNDAFYKLFPEFVNNEQPFSGNGTKGPYTATFGRSPILRGFVDDQPYQSSFVSNPNVVYPGTLTPYVFITTTDGNGDTYYIVDDGNGNLIQTDNTFQNGPSGPPQKPITAGTVDYVNGIATFSFIEDITSSQIIETQTSPFSAGFPRIALFFDNYIKLYPVPDRQYKISLDCYTTPAQFLMTNSAVPFAYMAEWLARGAARKILSDVGDMEQLQMYEPFFREQEMLVLRRTERQNSTQRTQTIFNAQSTTNNQFNFTNF